jgi:2C-methyl-D-erythritol 2,4-cyclodiphosphate synthase
MSGRKITCKVTGKSYTYGVDYFNTKVQEYKTIENLKAHFITRKVKTLIQRGYNVTEIRNMLSVDSSNLEDAESDSMKETLEYHRDISEPNIKRSINSTLNFTDHKSDPDVAIFINTIRNHE